MKRHKWFAVLAAMALVFTAFGCKTDTEYVDKNYCSAVTFTSQSTEDGVKVTMATSTKGAAIYYTTNGTAPTAKITKYSEPVEFTTDVTVKAIAIKKGLENSPISVATVSIKEKTIVETKTEYVDKKADEIAPANVMDLAAQEKDSRVLLTWTDAADEDVYGYEITYSGTNPINRVVLPALDSKTMMAGKGAGGCYVSGLENGTEYTFTVKTVDTSGNKSEGVTVKATPAAVDAGETMKIALTATVPQENGYTGNKSNTKVTVTANITTASKVKKVVWKKDGSLIAKILLADEEAKEATVTEENAVWTFDITATDESANGTTYTVAAIDEAGREEAEQITIDNFDFTAPGKVKVTSAVYSSDLSVIIINWTEPSDADYDHADITFTSNDGTANSEPSKAETVKKGTTEKTFSSIDGAKAYYTYTFVTYDELGNKGAEYKYKVTVNKSVIKIPEGFVEVTGTTINGDETWTPASKVFVSGRKLTIPDLIVCDHEVKQAEYAKYCKYGSSSPSSGYGVGDNYPAYYVNWYDAVVYCNLRSIDEELTPAYKIGEETDPRKWSGIVGDAENGYCGSFSSNSTWYDLTYDKTADGYRLPTEAEWEYIAREAGTSSTTYSGSNTIGDVAWYSSNSDSKTHEVKGKNANSLGIYDMSGNVWEWCYDWYSIITSSTAETGASSGSRRVLRGGSSYDNDYGCQVSSRYYYTPYDRINIYGFRVVRSSSK